MDKFVRRNPIIAMVLGNVLLGLNSMTAKIGFESIPPFLFAGLRYVIAAAFLLLIAHLAKEHAHGNWKHLGVQAVLQVILAVTWFGALTLTQAINVTIIFLLTPIMVYVGSVLFLGEPRSNRALTGGLIAFLGGLLMFGGPALNGGSNDELLGNGLILVSATTLAAMVLHAKSVITEKNIRLVLGFRWLMAGTVALLVSLTLEHPSEILDATRSSLIALLMATFVFGVLGVYLFYKALEHIRAEDSSSLLYMDTLAGALGATLILGETLSSSAILASGVIVAGILIAHPVHMNRYVYFHKFNHSKFEEFVRWAKGEYQEIRQVVKRYF